MSKDAELRICYMSKYGNLPEGVYIFKEPNIWSPALYFRKPKHADEDIYLAIREHIKAKLTPHNSDNNLGGINE